MGFDKAKVVRAAEKYLAQGKIPAAIKEYRQLVDNDPADYTALNMLGDLYARTGKNQEARTCFLRIAEHYREKGFPPRAIAMYRKIDRLEPGTYEIASRLAELYELQGLVADARAQYLIVADLCTRAGKAREALEVLSKVADLDPGNAQTRLKLAEGYLRENMRKEAADAYGAAGAQLSARGDHEAALNAFRRQLDLQPNDRRGLSGLLAAHIALGTADEAAETLEAALEEEPRETDLLAMLANAYIAADNGPEAERVATILTERDPAYYARLIEVTRLYLRNGNAAAAIKIAAQIAEHMLATRAEDELIELADAALAVDPEQLEALRLLARVYTWQRDDQKLQTILIRLAEAAEAAGLVEEERSAIVQLVRLSPGNRYYAERLKALGGANEDVHDDGSSGFTGAAKTGATAGEPPTFESFMFSTQDEPAPAPEPAVEFGWHIPEAPPTADPAASFADLNEGWAAGSSTAESSGTPPEAPVSTGFQEFDLGFSSPEPLAPEPAPQSPAPTAPSPGGTESRRDILLRQELESVDFYIGQGYLDIAVDTLDILERQFGSHELIDLRRAQLRESASPAPAAPARDDSVREEPVESGTTAATDISHEARTIEDDRPAGGVITENASESGTPLPESAQSGIDPGLAAIFDEFRSSIEEDEPAVSAEDYETHYNLGLAYKDMDLVDDAIEEFQIAAGLTAPNDGTSRYLHCCNMLGHCFMQKDMPRLAMMWFKKGLDIPGFTEEEYQALRYELGLAYERAGELERAIEVFSEVYGINVSYRGVADKLRELQAQRATG